MPRDLDDRQQVERQQIGFVRRQKVYLKTRPVPQIINRVNSHPRELNRQRMNDRWLQSPRPVKIFMQATAIRH